MIYIASPYSHNNSAIMHSRFLDAQNYTAHLLKERSWCYSPIVHTHELAKAHILPTDAGFWWDYNEHMLILSSALHVLQLTGWKSSSGVRMEIKWWQKRRRLTPIYMIDAKTYKKEIYLGDDK